MPQGGPSLESLERMLASGRDSALLRFGLGSEWLRRGDPAAALPHLRAAVTRDPAYSAAWKLLGRACEACGDREGAAAAWRQGVQVAHGRGDRQAAREMEVFLRRLGAAGGA